MLLLSFSSWIVSLWVDLCRSQTRKASFFAKYFVIYFYHIVSGDMRKEWRMRDKVDSLHSLRISPPMIWWKYITKYFAKEDVFLLCKRHRSTHGQTIQLLIHLLCLWWLSNQWKGLWFGRLLTFYLSGILYHRLFPRLGLCPVIFFHEEKRLWLSVEL